MQLGRPTPSLRLSYCTVLMFKRIPCYYFVIRSMNTAAGAGQWNRRRLWLTQCYWSRSSSRVHVGRWCRQGTWVGRSHASRSVVVVTLRGSVITICDGDL